MTALDRPIPESSRKPYSPETREQQEFILRFPAERP